MIHDRVGDHPHPVAGRVHPPAEVNVVHEQAHGGVEAADLLPDIAADQHSGAADGERVPVTVVLPLVDLPGLDAGDSPGRGVQRDAGLEDHLAVGPVLDLRAEHGGRAGLDRAPEQLLERVRGRLAVIVQQPEPLGPLARLGALRGRYRSLGRPVLQRPGDRGTVTGRPVHAEHGRLAELRGEHGAAAVPAAGVHRDDPLHRPGLPQHSVSHMRKPADAIVRDDDGSDDMLRIRLVRRQDDPVADRGAAPLAGRLLPGASGGPVSCERYAKIAEQNCQTASLPGVPCPRATAGRPDANLLNNHMK